jgi:hypothetical protein
MSDDEGYAPAAQMLICFIFPACVQKNTDADDRCHQEVTRDSFVKGILNYTVWVVLSGIVDERGEGNGP